MKRKIDNGDSSENKIMRKTGLKKGCFYKAALAYSITLICLYLIIKLVSINTISASLSKVNFVNYLVALVIYGATLVVSSFKYFFLIPNMKLSLLLRVTIISQLFVTLLPGQLGGDVAKIYHLKKNGHTGSFTAACVVIDRITGLAAMMLVALLGIVLSSYRSQIPSVLIFVQVIGLLIIGLFFTWSVFSNDPSRKFAGMKRNGFFGQVIDIISLTALALHQSSRDVPRLLSVFLLSIIFQLLAVIIFVQLARTLVPSVSFIEWFWINGIVSIISLFPFSIGGLGVREGGFAAVLSLLGVPVENAVALSLSTYTIQLLGALCGACLYVSEMIGERRTIRKVGDCIVNVSLQPAPKEFE